MNILVEVTLETHVGDIPQCHGGFTAFHIELGEVINFNFEKKKKKNFNL